MEAAMITVLLGEDVNYINRRKNFGVDLVAIETYHCLDAGRVDTKKTCLPYLRRIRSV